MQSNPKINTLRDTTVRISISSNLLVFSNIDINMEHTIELVEVNKEKRTVPIALLSGLI